MFCRWCFSVFIVFGGLVVRGRFLLSVVRLVLGFGLFSALRFIIVRFSGVSFRGGRLSLSRSWSALRNFLVKGRSFWM